MKDGKGKFVYETGDYEGHVENGLPGGAGKWTKKAGIITLFNDGEFAEGKLKKGTTFRKFDGDYYRGDIVDDKPNGQGEWLNGRG